MILSTGFVYLGWNYFLVLGHPPHCGKFPRRGDLADIWSRVDQIWSDISDVRGDHMALGIMARLLGHRMTRTKVRRACRRKCSGKASLINSNVLAACAMLSHFCLWSIVLLVSQAGSFPFLPSSTLYPVLVEEGSGSTGNLGKAEVNP